ncbi:branched-chain amino acid transporter permease [Corynebacterium hindlerae]|nr:AzlD domain-containing protein [Corynebacterium hindlerae]
MDSYFFMAVGTAVAVTFMLRALPFAIKAKLSGSPFLENFGRWMPQGAMIILLLYCLHGVGWGPTHVNVGYGVGLAVTAGVHLWRRNAVLSIVAGTIACVALSTGLA